MIQGALFVEASDPDWPCLPHGPGLLHGHVWSDADDYAVCGCSMRVTFAQLSIPERPRKVWKARAKAGEP